MTHWIGVSCTSVVLHLMVCQIPQIARRLLRSALPRIGMWAGVAALVLGAAVAGAAESIKLEAEAAQQFYREGADNVIFVEARVIAGEAVETDSAQPAVQERAGSPAAVRNIAFVLDRSGSMDGERMEALREAVAGVLDTLDDRDVVSIVTFGSEVETFLEATRCDQARTALAALPAIEAAGGAALYEGLSQGAAQARRLGDLDSINQLILVTDGAATKGPREREDFVRLVEGFVRDGLTVSAIGLGDEFEEDVLAAIARAGGGRFRFAGDLSHLAGALRAEIAPARQIAARDAVLTLEFRTVCDDVRARGAPAARVQRSAVTIRYPRILVGQRLSVVASGELAAYGTIGIQRDLVRATLRWSDPATGEARELTEAITIRFSPDSRDAVETLDLQVYRAAAAALVTEGLQEAIERLDAGDPRRAVRELRRTRAQLLDINNTPQDADLAAMVARLDDYLAEVQSRGLSAVDRKILRSGLLNAFEMPVAEDEAAAARP